MLVNQLSYSCHFAILYIIRRDFCQFKNLKVMLTDTLCASLKTDALMVALSFLTIWEGEMPAPENVRLVEFGHI